MVLLAAPIAAALAAGAGAAAHGAAASPGKATITWWSFPSADCGYDDFTAANCTGRPLAECERLCAQDALCGGFNFPHGILKKLSCLAKKTAAGPTSTLYIKGHGPQPPPPPPPPPVPDY
eukprot:SAG22_NODE_14973_length_360_cov_0.988506_1_plen_119_part_11